MVTIGGVGNVTLRGVGSLLIYFRTLQLASSAGEKKLKSCGTGLPTPVA